MTNSKFFHRFMLHDLREWKQKSNHKPLVLRGSRQVGKTALIDEFGKSFSQYIKINLERKEHARYFENYSTITNLVDTLFLVFNKELKENTLLFIDEIQTVPEAFNTLRFFYEDYPMLHVIAAGSLLEAVLKENMKVPVGRVEYKILRPMSFFEFLLAKEDTVLTDLTNTIPLPDHAYDILFDFFHTYTLIGGMPEVVSTYLQRNQLLDTIPVYDSLIQAFIDDIEKYARNQNMTQVIRHVIRSMSFEAGARIKFQNFGNSNYKSREVGEAIRVLELTYILQLIYPLTNTSLPLIPDKKKSPRLQIIDTGLLNHMRGLRAEILNTPFLDEVHHGKILEHIVGQELHTISASLLDTLFFWTKESSNSNAEIDFVIAHNGLMIPIEIKSGAVGRLRSLHEFIDRAPHPFAVRLYRGKISIDTLETLSGKSYYLLNLPYFLTWKIREYLNWMMSIVEKS